MSVTEIEAAITRLSPPELAELLAWISEHQAQLWDRQIEQDLEEGRLDALLADVHRECDDGLARPL